MNYADKNVLFMKLPVKYARNLTLETPLNPLKIE